MKTFTSEIQLEKVSSRVQSLISFLNTIPISGNVCMIVLDAKSIPETKGITGTIQLAFNDVKATFKVRETSMERLGAFASRYNMCMAHYCDIKLSLVEPSTLKIDFIPPNETYEEVIADFFEITSFPCRNE